MSPAKIDAVFCRVNGCNSLRHHRNTLCTKHIQRKRAHGSEFWEPPTSRQRFESCLDPRRQPDECWIWPGGPINSGYGSFGTLGRTMLAHRFAYSEFVGALLAGMQIDHTCGVKLCVNPRHLEQVTGAENTRRAIAVGYGPLAPKLCRNGHDWDETSPRLVHRRDGRVSRRCVQCARASDNRRRAAR